ncbi:uncharacterized protein LOC124918822 isoform X2 [Impatiens glandulifera]|uniref:uncharacterized protein LOC124918822 isoform X2 n=1 Tax=Impatiens glandulifera TaxID=253017 RepID=UPI001FB16E7D|nr:uncharacterized protein LOC124918822 isoform X2 [Impatiens glandulifera]
MSQWRLVRKVTKIPSRVSFLSLTSITLFVNSHSSSMGEQNHTLQTQTHTKIQFQSHHQPNSKTQQPTIDSNEEDPLDLSNNTSSKIPVRPNKLRKLTSSDDIAETKSSSHLADADADSSNIVVAVENGAPSVSANGKSRRRNQSLSARAQPSIIRPLSADGEIERAIVHLRAADPLLVELIDSLPRPAFDSRLPPFLALTKSILYQQLAYRAGNSVYSRFIELCGGEDGVHPNAVLSISTQLLRQIGVSGRKAVYLYDLANKYNTGILSDQSIIGMDDKSLTTMLSMVKGIGSWSVHMFMVFSLHRPDVLPVSDTAIRKGVQMLYGLVDLPRPSQIEQLCEKWRPFRSVGSWYMWRLVEGKGNAHAGGPAVLEAAVPLQQQMVQQETLQQQQQHQLQLLEPIPGNTSLGGEYFSVFENDMIDVGRL